jgi:CxxC-x17-CxxC domain-containing protein
MKNFKTGGFRKERGGDGMFPRGGGAKRPGGSYSKRPERSVGGERGGRDEREMFTASCTSCGKSCEVPFRPSGDRPVLCRDCYVRKDGDAPRDERRPDARPVRREERAPAEYPTVRVDRGMEEVKQKLATLEAKLNRILDLINPPQPRAVAPETTVSEVVVVKKERKPKKEAAAPKKKVTKKTSK